MKIEKYNFLMKAIHWFMAICLIGMIYSGWFMVSIPRIDPIKWEWYSYHKAVGICLILLILLRILVRFRSKIPLNPKEFSPTINFIAKMEHLLLYTLMILVPLDGLFMSQFGGHSVNVFGITIPQMVEVNQEIASLFHTIHEYVPYVLLVAIIAHVGAVIYHYVFDKVNILKRMT